MSKKIAITAIILLVFGSITVPTGIVADQYIDDLIYANLHTGLQGIKEEAGPIVENIVNITFSATIMSLAYIYLTTQTGDFALALEYLFNDISDTSNITYVESGDTVEVECLSFYYAQNLSFSVLAQNRIAWGYGKKASSNYIPGLLNDTYNGENAAWDAIEFWELYDEAINNPTVRTKMESNYNCSWSQLVALNNYSRNYIYYDKIPQVIEDAEPGKGLFLIKPELEGKGLKDTEEIAYFYFVSQWANGSLVPEGFPLPLGFMEAKGLEVGVPEPSNISLSTAYNLWNESLEYSLLSSIGMERWKAAMENPDSNIASYLQSVHDLSDIQMTMLLE